MSTVTERSGILGHVVVQEINPKTGEIVSVEEGENIICVGGANAISTALTTGSFATTFDWMVISTDVAAAARAHTAIAPQTAVSTEIVPTVDNTAPTSKTIWEHTFAAGGSAVIGKFGMQSTNIGGVLWNEYVFSALKDNNSNDLKITYTASIAP